MKLRLGPELDDKHRPWTVPRLPWIMVQTWSNLLFAHWPVNPEILRPYIPAQLQLDTFDGTAWLGVVPFRLSTLRFRGIPEIGPTSNFNEINLRTYVTYSGKPGILFLSMDADNALAVAAARPTFRLPYTLADMSFEDTSRGYTFRSVRRGNIDPPAVFKATYHPTGKKIAAEPGSLDRWLTERYCYYTATPTRVYRCEIFHLPWPLQPANATIETNTLAEALGIKVEQTAPLLHYSHKITALIWPLMRAREQPAGN
jgi:uncharacterized protein YqjF (DUF2071 family)